LAAASQTLRTNAGVKTFTERTPGAGALALHALSKILNVSSGELAGARIEHDVAQLSGDIL